MSSVRKTVLGAVVAGVFALAAQPAAADSFSFSFNTGDVRAAYSDGYWDHNRQWHKWRSNRERRAFRDQYGNLYIAKPSYRYRDRGWRDRDGDGIPNRYDRRPNNPYRG